MLVQIKHKAAPIDYYDHECVAELIISTVILLLVSAGCVRQMCMLMACPMNTHAGTAMTVKRKTKVMLLTHH